MARLSMVEQICEFDDGLLERYLQGEELKEEQLVAAIRGAAIRQEIVPVLCGSAFRNMGIQSLLDGVVDFLPSPLDIPPVHGLHPQTREDIQRRPADDEPLAALVFKITTDPFVGQLAFLRLYSGTLSSGMQVIVPTHGRRRADRPPAEDPRQQARGGRGGARRGHRRRRRPEDGAHRGDRLLPGHSIILETMEFPDPVLSVAIEPRTAADEEKLAVVLEKLCHEDPTFRVRREAETGETIISGMGELHLDVLVQRMIRDFGIEATIGRPQVAYREATTLPAEGEARYVRQTGGRGQYGHVRLRIEPGERGSGFQFEDRVTGGVIPREYIPSVRRGTEESLQRGFLAGYEVIDVRVILEDGSFHEVDSSEMAFKIAGSLAVREALKQAGVVLLEPLMRVEVLVPEAYMGEVMGNLSSRRGRIESLGTRRGLQVITADVPLAEMFGYATDLRSLTQGRADFTMEFRYYGEVPRKVRDEILARTAG